MRFLVRCVIPARIANRLIQTGTLFKQLMKYVNDVKPEQVYLAPCDGQRALYFVLDMQNIDKMAAVTEPPWLDWEADLDMTPVMTLADLEKAGADMEKLIRERQ
ncbi:MAG TPA: hypothetical protein VEG65_07185 [Candidatus Bathyarchaeia archaeon]|nr:hypothetical protein [Candidatus Bathyarchaeia archaeon]